MTMVKYAPQAVSAIATTFKMIKNKVPIGNIITGAIGWEALESVFDADDGEAGNTPAEDANQLKKTAMALISDMETGGIPLNGLKTSRGEPLETNYIVIDITGNRGVFPINQYISKKMLRGAKRRGGYRGAMRQRRNTKFYTSFR
jgi:hypothetical protein